MIQIQGNLVSDERLSNIRKLHDDYHLIGMRYNMILNKDEIIIGLRKCAAGDGDVM